MQEEKFNEQDGNFDQPNVNESLALAGLFRKVLVKERLPEKSGTYYSSQGRSVLDYTHPVNVTAWKEGRDGLEWWLEEIELPNDAEINKQANIVTQIENSLVQVVAWTYYAKGQIDLRERVLAGKAVTAKDNVR